MDIKQKLIDYHKQKLTYYSNQIFSIEYGYDQIPSDVRDELKIYHDHADFHHSVINYLESL